MTAKIKKSRFNIIDFFIVLVVILILAGVALRYDWAKKINFQANQEKFEIEFIIENIQEQSQSYLKAGEPFYITTASIKIGEIKEILDIRPAAIFVKTQDGDTVDIVKGEIPEQIDITGILTCYGKKLDTGYMINGTISCAAGKEFLVHTGVLEVTMTVISVNKAEE